MTILEELSDYARVRVREKKKLMGPEQIKEAAEALPPGDFAFERALRDKEMAFILEVKKASPSKGIIAENFPYLEIAKEYEAAGADGISVLTEPKWFLGSESYLKEISGEVSVPCIRKDFVVDSYMLYEARLLGASAVLLICAVLNDRELAEYLSVCEKLGLSALVEAHDAEEIRRALGAGARLIGVNNRNLADFSVDTGNAGRLRELVPENVAFVSESGVKDAEDIRKLRNAGIHAVLIGETMMRAEDKSRKLAELKSLL